LANAIESSLVVLRDGNKDFGIPSIDPLFLKYAEVNHAGGTSSFNLKSSLKNINLSGLSSSKVKRVAVKFDKKFGVKAEALTPKIDLIGEYSMKGQIVMLPINGFGKCSISMTNVSTTADLRGDYIEKDGETYINVTSFKLKLKPQHMKLNFENLFNGDKALSQTLNNFMNENWELVANQMLPGYEKHFGELFKGIAGKIFSAVPMKFMFLD